MWVQQEVFASVLPWLHPRHESLMLWPHSHWARHGPLRQLAAATNTSEKVIVESGHLERKRQKAYTTFHHANKATHNNRPKNLAKNLTENGLTPHTPGSTHKWPKHSLPFEITEFVTFLLSYVQENGLSFLGRYLGTVTQISSSFLLAYQREAYGKRTIVQLKRMASSDDAAAISHHHEAKDWPLLDVPSEQHSNSLYH